MSGRTTWWPKDAAWLRRELVVELGDEFGPSGPLVLDALCGWAQEQRSSGLVRGGWRALAREAFVTVCCAQTVVERAAQIGALDDLELDSDGRRFTCRVSGWQADVERGRSALRMAKSRAVTDDLDDDSEPNTPEQDATARNVLRRVTPRPLHNITKEEQHPQTPKGDLPVPLVAPVKPSGQRKRDLDKWQAEFDAWASEHFPGVEPRGLAGLVSWVQSRQVPATPDAVREFAESAPNFAHVLEPAA